MAAEQTLIVTAMPRALTLDGPTLPVSISVSVRLRGASKLGCVYQKLKLGHIGDAGPRGAHVT
jgi:hypothetical protein